VTLLSELASAGDAIAESAGDVKVMLQEHADTAGEKVSHAKDAVTSTVIDIQDAADEMAHDVKEGTVEGASGLKGFLSRELTEAKDAIKGMFSSGSHNE